MQKKGDKSNNKGLINSEEEEEQQGDDSESLEKMENIRLIKEYRDQLNEEKEVDNDPILDDYIDNFTEVRKKYHK